MQLKKIVGWAVVIFLAWYLFTRPVGAGHAVQHVFGLIKTAGSSVATFLSNL